MLKGKKKGSIVISLGDDGAIATCFEGGLLTKRYFVSSPYAVEFSDLIKDHPKYPVYLILDTIDQNYVFSTFPALRSGNLMKMVNRKITNEFDPSDINAFLCQGKDDSSVRKDLKYIFVSIRNSTPLTDWLEYLKEAPNKFMGIYTYPIESEDFIEKLQKKFPKDMGEGHKSKWRILISHNRVGGFRQVVYKGGKVIFTRISQAGNIQSPDSIGVNISQEAANTLEYIRRIGFNDDSLSVYVVSSKDTFQFIEIPGVEAEDLALLSPYEVAEGLGLKNSALESDKFGDVIFASSFLANKKKRLRISNKVFDRINKLNLMHTAIKAALGFVITVMPILIFYMLYEFYINNDKISEQEDLSRQYKSQLSSIKIFEDQFGVNPDFLVDVVEVSDKVTKNKEFFHDILLRFIKANEARSLVSNLSYKEDDREFNLSIATELNTDGVTDYADLIIRAQDFARVIRNEFSNDYKDIIFANMPNEDNIKFDSITDQSKISESLISILIKGKLNN